MSVQAGSGEVVLEKQWEIPFPINDLHEEAPRGDFNYRLLPIENDDIFFYVSELFSNGIYDFLSINTEGTILNEYKISNSEMKNIYQWDGEVYFLLNECDKDRNNPCFSLYKKTGEKVLSFDSDERLTYYVDMDVNGNYYFENSEGNKTTKLNHNGEILWSVDVGGEYTVIDNAGNIYGADSEDKLTKVGLNGEVIWKTATSVSMSQLSVNGDTAFVNNYNELKLNEAYDTENGKLLATIISDSQLAGGIHGDGYSYFVDFYHNFFTFDHKTKKYSKSIDLVPIIEDEESSGIDFAPVYMSFTPDGHLHVTTNSVILEFDKQGNFLDKITFENNSFYNEFLYKADGSKYHRTSEGLAKFDISGQLVWEMAGNIVFHETSKGYYFAIVENGKGKIAFYKEVNTSEVVAKDKEWTISFNQKLDSQSLTGNIYVTDKAGVEWKTSTRVDDTGTKVLIKPVDDYIQGEYKLIITTKVENIDGKNLKEEVTKKFQVAN